MLSILIQDLVTIYRLVVRIFFSYQVAATTNGGAIIGNWSLVVRAATKAGGMYED